MRTLANKSLYDESTTSKVLENVQFPIRYNFLQNVHTGVVTRDFGTSDPASGTKYFRLVNPSSGKVLAARFHGSVVHVTVQDYSPDDAYDNSHQLFSLDDKSQLISAISTDSDFCLVNDMPKGYHDSCQGGNELSLVLTNDNRYGADAKKWIFHRDGSIVSKICTSCGVKHCMQVCSPSLPL